MFDKIKRVLAVLCALALVITMVPVSAEAAAKPKFAKKYSSLYENGDKGGVYTYTVKNLTKGQKVKWTVTGTGKSYAKLKKTTTTATKTSVSNTLTINTKGKAAAKNKIVNVTAKIYSKAGKLVSTLSSGNAKIKVKTTKIEIVSDALSQERLYIGESYQFQYKLTPANGTSTNTWSVSCSDGSDVSSAMTKTGVFTPEKEGTYTITATAKSGSAKRTAQATVVVGRTMTAAKQVAADKAAAVFSSSARDQVDKDSFTLYNAAGAKVEIKNIAFSGDGTEAILTTYSCFEDGKTYRLTDGVMEYSFIARVGKPAQMKVLTTETTVAKATTIEYGIYDANGIEVSAKYPGTIRYEEPKITNGYIIEEKNQIYMTSEGDTGTFKMVYTSQDDPTLVLSASAQITCVAASIATETNLTLTTEEAVPNYDAADYKDNRKVAAGGNYYMHFRALDTDGGVLKYDSVEYESSDPDTLLINNRENGIAKVTAIKKGTVKILVTARYGKQTHAYSYEVSVVDQPYLSGITADKSVVYTSSRMAYGDREYIKITAVDQYGEAFALKDETAQIVDNSVYKADIVTYDAATDRIVVNTYGRIAGTYNYTLTLTCGTQKAQVNFTIVVQTPPENGTVSYNIVIDNPELDIALTKDSDISTCGDINIRVAEYRGGVFYGYTYISSVKVMKDNLYYYADLTQTPSEKEVDLGSGDKFTLKALSLNGTVCTKAPTGNYIVTVRFYAQNSSGTSIATASSAFKIKDTQAAPEVTVVRSKATATCKNAVELAKNCLSVTGVENAEITECVVTGSQTVGSSYTLGAGEAVNIKSITVQVKTTINGGKTVVSSYTIPVGKTLKNA